MTLDQLNNKRGSGQNVKQWNYRLFSGFIISKIFDLSIPLNMWLCMCPLQHIGNLFNYQPTRCWDNLDVHNIESQKNRHNSIKEENKDITQRGKDITKNTCVNS